MYNFFIIFIMRLTLTSDRQQVCKLHIIFSFLQIQGQIYDYINITYEIRFQKIYIFLKIN